MSLTHMQTAEKILSRLEKKDHKTWGWLCKCPAHDDSRNSLTIALGETGVVVKCHAGCTYDAVVEAVGLKSADLFYDREGIPMPREIEATYDYKSPGGDLEFQVVRMPGKEFLARRPHPNGREWIWSLTGGHYDYNGVGRLHKVEAATITSITLPPVTKYIYAAERVSTGVSLGRTIFIVEGEKDADRLNEMGFYATTNHGGAGKWQEIHSHQLMGAERVVIIPDNDEPGLAHSREVAASVWPITSARVAILNLEVPEKQDISYWLDHGGSKDQLVNLSKQAFEVGEGTPGSVEAEQSPVPSLTPGDIVQEFPSPYQSDETVKVLEQLAIVKALLVEIKSHILREAP